MRRCSVCVFIVQCVLVNISRWLLNPERNGPFHFVLFQILHLEAIQYLSLNPKNFDLGIPNPKSELFLITRKLQSVLSRSVPFCPVPFHFSRTAYLSTYAKTKI